MASVLPVPAPAKIKTGPSVVSAARRCSGFSASRKLFIRHRARARAYRAMVAEEIRGDKWQGLRPAQGGRRARSSDERRHSLLRGFRQFSLEIDQRLFFL